MALTEHQILVNFTKTLFTNYSLFTKYKSTNIQQISGSRHFLIKWFLQIYHHNYFPYQYICIFFLSGFSFHKHSRIAGVQGRGVGIKSHYHFHLLHRRLHISRTITAESSPLHIASSRTRTGSLWFPNANR